MEELEKPHILYALPRSRSSAILEASTKKYKLYEPFGGVYIDRCYENPNDLVPIEFEEEKYWNKTVLKLNNKNYCTKMIANQFKICPTVLNWFKEIQTKQTHKIFVVYRNMKDICWSHTLSTKFGWKVEEQEAKNIKFANIEENNFLGIESHIKCFIDLFPNNATKLSWERLPELFFDKNLVKMREQFSQQTSKDKITNIEYCIDRIDQICKKYEEIYEEKFLTLPWAK